MKYTVRVWDAPTRLFHWLLAACVVGLVISAQIGGMAMEWHFRLGYTVLSLLLFRVVWGLSRWALVALQAFSLHTWSDHAYLKGRRATLRTALDTTPLGAFSCTRCLDFSVYKSALD